MVHFLKRNRKQMNSGELVELRLGLFKELLELSKKYKGKSISIVSDFYGHSS